MLPFGFLAVLLCAGMSVLGLAHTYNAWLTGHREIRQMARRGPRGSKSFYWSHLSECKVFWIKQHSCCNLDGRPGHRLAFRRRCQKKRPCAKEFAQTKAFAQSSSKGRKTHEGCHQSQRPRRPSLQSQPHLRMMVCCLRKKPKPSRNRKPRPKPKPQPRRSLLQALVVC